MQSKMPNNVGHFFIRLLELYVTTNNFGIWGPHQAFYIHSMLADTESAIKALKFASQIIEEITSGVIGTQIKKDELLDSMQIFVTHSGAISRFFFPPQHSPRKATEQQKNIHKFRAEHLRRVFGIEAVNVLENRNLRNTIEHFDERLDIILQNGIVGQIFPSLILNEPETTDISHHIFRTYYLKSGVYQVLEDRYEIQPVANEILRIHNLLLDFDANGSVFAER